MKFLWRPLLGAAAEALIGVDPRRFPAKRLVVLRFLRLHITAQGRIGWAHDYLLASRPALRLRGP